MSSIDELSTDNYSDDGDISTNSINDIRYGSQIHPDMNAKDATLKYFTMLSKLKMDGTE